MITTEVEKREALIALLSLPDSPDLRRAHHLRFEGRADRYQVLPHLTAAFVQHHLVELDERGNWRTSTTF